MKQCFRARLGAGLAVSEPSSVSPRTCSRLWHQGAGIPFMLHDGLVGGRFLGYSSSGCCSAPKSRFSWLSTAPGARDQARSVFRPGAGRRAEALFSPCRWGPYSPQLSPDEQDRNHVKRRVARRVPQNRDELTGMLVSSLHHLLKRPRIVRGYVRNSDIYDLAFHTINDSYARSGIERHKLMVLLHRIALSLIRPHGKNRVDRGQRWASCAVIRRNRNQKRSRMRSDWRGLNGRASGADKFR